MRLSIVLPTYNERENILPCIARIDEALQGAGITYEVVVVDDDSPDRTWEIAEELSRKRTDIHLIRRIGRRGLSSAVVEGFAAANGELLLVMDADLQHDAGILPKMANSASEAGVDLVVATRYAQGGSTGVWSRKRWLLSRLATIMSWLVIRTRVSDPMSGFFLVSRAVWSEVAPRVDARGFKILLEIIARTRPLGFREIGYTFSIRQHGESKLDSGVGIAYLRALYGLSFGRIISLRLLLYCFVGASGVVVNLGVVWLLHRHFGLSENVSLISGIATAMLSNFALNNFITFGDRRRQGTRALVIGILLFTLISSGGAVINYSVARFMMGMFGLGIFVSDLIGIVFATIWNFSLNRHITWKKPRT